MSKNKPTDRFSQKCPVFAYTNKYGKDPLFFESITEASRMLKIPVPKIKELICKGGCEDGYHSFDIPPWCDYDIISEVINGKFKYRIIKTLSS